MKETYLKTENLSINFIDNLVISYVERYTKESTIICRYYTVETYNNFITIFCYIIIYILSFQCFTHLCILI